MVWCFMLNISYSLLSALCSGAKIEKNRLYLIEKENGRWDLEYLSIEEVEKIKIIGNEALKPVVASQAKELFESFKKIDPQDPDKVVQFDNQIIRIDALCHELIKLLDKENGGNEGLSICNPPQ